MSIIIDGSAVGSIQVQFASPVTAAVTAYATVAELRTASEGSLASGYYETGDQIVYWDGVEFTPYLTASVFPDISDFGNMSASLYGSAIRLSNADTLVVTPNFDPTTELSGLGFDAGSWALS